ncbi:MAG: lytic transglycosylase domain-containing protein [Treponema sp.]|jgi:soluble lytic murein transglycosylase|nr:lytic transglycosylase domain-containing protein [Treponema sp.]
MTFILNMDPSEIGQITKMHPSAPFYVGLNVQGAVRGKSLEDAEIRHAEDLAVALFAVALESPSARVREEAAKKLIIPVLTEEDTAVRVLALTEINMADTAFINTGMFALVTLRGAALYRLGGFNETREFFERYGVRSSWDRAISLLAGLRSRNKATGKATPENLFRNLHDFFLLGVPDEAYGWAFTEMRNSGASDFFTDAEYAAIAGRLAVSRAALGEAMKQFRLVLNQNRSIFFQYPVLLTELGRCFLFTGSLGEGIKLFLEWDQAVQAGTEIPPIEVRNIRFRLLYAAARMERQGQHHTQAAEYFAQALAFAPDALQEDSCIWYILSMTLADKPEQVPALVHTYLPRWNQDAYFSDILDGLCRYLTAKRQWGAMLTIFALIKSRSDGLTIAKYAYILGRAVSEDYIPAREAAVYLKSTGMAGIDTPKALKTLVARTFFRIAFEEKQASLYYRGLSAAYLGETILLVSTKSGEAEKGSDAMALLLGFFEFGAVSHIAPYLANLRDALSIPELRTMSEAFAAAGQWIESIRVLTYAMGRQEYVLTRSDMERYYPRPFQDLIEEKARDAGIPVEILYGLIRTESAFMADIVSHAGAVGLTQLMPKTAQEEADRILRQGGPNYRAAGPLELRNPEINVPIGASYLSYLIGRLDSPMLALLSYNGGMTRIRRWRAVEPKFPEDLFLETVEYAETREYGKRVLAAAAAYGFLYYDLGMERVVADIFKE